MTFVRTAGILRLMPRPIRATISAAALAHNLTIARTLAGAAKIWAVIKANAYGHGLLRAAQALREADGFAMLDYVDALRLRSAGVTKPILMLEGFFKPADNRKPPTVRNQFGFTFGGPIKHDRTFFFADFEGSRWRINPFALTSVPNARMRQGLLPVDVRVPINFTDASGRPVAAGTVIAAGTAVPMTKLARFMMDNLPQANRNAPAIDTLGEALHSRSEKAPAEEHDKLLKLIFA